MKILTQWERRRPAEELVDVTPLLELALRQTAQVLEVEKSLNFTRLAKVEKWRETNLIQCFEVA